MRGPAQRLCAVLLAAVALHGCAMNPLAAIDGPYVSPSERAARAAAAAGAAAATTPATTAVEESLLAEADTTPVAPADSGVAVTAAGPVAEPAPVTPPEPAAQAAIALPRPAELPPLIDPANPAAAAPGAPPSLALSTPDENAAYGAFHAFVTERLGRSASARQSMLLVDPPSLEPTLRACAGLPAAVLVDLDPAGALMPMVGPVRTDGGLAMALGDLRQRGVTIYWITGHSPGQAGEIRRRLAEAGLDPSGDDPLIVTRFAGESKQARRQALGGTDCLLAILGDQRADFDELYDYLLSPEVGAPLDVLIGNGWFLAPPPLQ